MGKKILLVDDEFYIVSLTKARLEVNNYEVDTAYNGLEALEKIKESKPDLILLDILMPGIDGLEFCRRLKTDKATCDIPIVIFTASQQKELSNKCLEAGAKDVVMKPYDACDLLNTIDKAISDKGV